MDPSGGAFGIAFIVNAIIIAMVWLLAPFNWALGITIALVVLFVVFVVFILSNARFT